MPIGDRHEDQVHYNLGAGGADLTVLTSVAHAIVRRRGQIREVKFALDDVGTSGDPVVELNVVRGTTRTVVGTVTFAQSAGDGQVKSMVTPANTFVEVGDILAVDVNTAGTGAHGLVCDVLVEN